LQFYIAPRSPVRGYASKEQGIHVNLQALLQASFDMRQFKAHLYVLIAHEHAHYLFPDGHSRAHARRTEENMRKLLSKALV
jgi:hypothetical protein